MGVHAYGGILVCCKQPITLQVKDTMDAAKEKHVPIGVSPTFL